LDDITMAKIAGGGALHDITVGLSWYLNPNTKVMWNYTHSENDLTSLMDQDADIIQMRLQIDF
jgi:phosphate-selective porin OprO/OprP